MVRTKLAPPAEYTQLVRNTRCAEHWAATHRREAAEIVALMAAVRADRATRSAPNAAPDCYGEGK